jgi:hypothetical protein
MKKLPYIQYIQYDIIDLTGYLGYGNPLYHGLDITIKRRKRVGNGSNTQPINFLRAAP